VAIDQLVAQPALMLRDSGDSGISAFNFASTFVLRFLSRQRLIQVKDNFGIESPQIGFC
jgi:hypothetical protein